MASHHARALEVREGDPVAAPTPATTSQDAAAQPEAANSEQTAIQQTQSTKTKPREKCSRKHVKCKGPKVNGKVSTKNHDNSDSSDSGPSDSDSDSDEEPAPVTKHRRNSRHASNEQITLKNMRLKKPEKSARSGRKAAISSSSSSTSDSDDSTNEKHNKSSARADKNFISSIEKLQAQIAQLSMQMTQQQTGQLQTSPFGDPITTGLDAGLNASQQQLLALRNLGLSGLQTTTADTASNSRAARTARRRASQQSASSLNSVEEALLAQAKLQEQKTRNGEPVLDFKRVDHVWDNSIHDYRLQDTAAPKKNDSYDEYIFHVRRHFDWEGKYKTTYVDVKSKALRECLQQVIGNVKGLSLVDEVPKLDPNLLFLYLDELRSYLKVLKKSQPTSKDKHERKKQAKHMELARKHLKVLVKYLDKDYADIKKSLYPMLENGLITFDLLWALWKPNTLAYTTTYGSPDEPRIFRVETAEKHKNMMKGAYYYMEGKFFEYDGKQFGYGNTSEEVTEFRGARKITSLDVYPLQYHKDEASLRKQLIERGKKFVALAGVQYKSHQGMAYMKKKKAIIKHNVNGRIMIDANVHRRINPNYPVSTVKPKEHECATIEEDSSDEEGGCGGDLDDDEKPIKWVTRARTDLETDETYTFKVRKEEMEEDPDRSEEVLEDLDGTFGKDDESDVKGGGKTLDITDEDYLIASPVVLGFAFTEKLWLEFTVSGVKDISWNEKAWDSLVLPPKTKSIVKALVKTHKYNAAESIDDVIQGKGKGLVAVLHGPPGTGKTLTAEGISELLKCPLYMVSAGELGTDSRYLEHELQRILDICHAWGAILLLDEADIFLEKRNMTDIHRNAMVSIFLRQLEYFQGILFLTTNRVETFDDAFQSRIHIALRYGKLDARAKKAIFRIFIERVRAIQKNPSLTDATPFTDGDLNDLARHELNGREIKNTVGTAQALAINMGESLAMKHIREVLGVQMSFDRDLKGGPGYEEAMMGYM